MHASLSPIKHFKARCEPFGNQNALVFVISLELQNESVSTILYRFINRETETPMKLDNLPRAHSKQGPAYSQSHLTTLSSLGKID